MGEERSESGADSVRPLMGEERSESGADSVRPLMELRAVVFGGKFAGKTTLINAVFGKDFLPNQKRTAQCEKLQGNVCGRELTLVDTPGWWKHFPLSDTANFLKKELVQGVSLCHPGPHAILLVIEIDIPFTEKHRKTAVDHLALLGDQIWTHTLVLFTRSRSLGKRTIEQHIEKEGEALKWLIERCGNRYHVFDSTVSDNTSQVTQLLEKIEDIVRINDGAHFQIEAKILEETAEWKTTVMTRAKSRELKQRERLEKEARVAVAIGKAEKPR
ncbi:GTPase IMAP family member 7-like [Colossoma macropomum]|uniref:GTPase IMAP family member 7-like n=1 Tax=Colossoma macropomum TaxID=42526 RepID=UPI001864D05A|nr:GTPase IMAP family member 7-like [Colossoma macropomum]